MFLLWDLAEGVISLDPVFTISGTVVKGFGRGSKVGGGRQTHVLLAWDLVEGVIPLDPVFTISGTVVKDFGRGSKVRQESSLL